MATIASVTHPSYDASLTNWNKYRAAFNGGHKFVDTYVEKFSVREDSVDFENRKKISYCPSHAKAALIKIKNSIYSRLNDIVREGGPDSYQDAAKGQNGGVDRLGSTLTNFIGSSVLEELLHQAKVGVYIDKPEISDGANRAETRGLRPYMYIYRANEIRSWTYDSSNNLTALLLQDNDYEVDPETGLVTGEVIQYRYLRLLDGKVVVKIYDHEGKQVGEDRILALKKIPFAIFELSHSLMEDVADYQIALTNVASSDLLYTLKSNFPFYTEMFDPMTAVMFQRQAITPKPTSVDETFEAKDGKASYAAAAANQEIKTGIAQGRRYPKGMERPGFIHPSAEPLMASLEHRKILKEEIHQLVNLSLANLDYQRASAESKKKDDEGLDSGLAYIGMQLEKGEKQIAEIWAAYEGDESIITVKYPQNYSLKSDEDRRDEAKDLEDRMDKIPSITYQKGVAKRIVKVLMGNHMPPEDLDKAMSEIDKAEVIVSSSEVLSQDVETGLVSLDTASKIRGYKDGEVEKAAEDRAKRAAAVALAQSKATMAGSARAENPAARGNKDSSADPDYQAKAEKDQTRLEK